MDERIDQSVNAYLGFLAREPELTVTVTRELPALGSRGIALQEEDIDRYVGLLMEMTRNPGMSDAGVEPVDAWTAAMLIGGVAEILDRAIREGKPVESVGADDQTGDQTGDRAPRLRRMRTSPGAPPTGGHGRGFHPRIHPGADVGSAAGRAGSPP